MRVPFIIYADFEAYNIPVYGGDTNKNNKTDEHIAQLLRRITIIKEFR